MKNSIADKIIELRHDRGWTQQQLADEAKLSRLMVNKFEKDVIPSKGSFQKLTIAFKLDEDYFFKEFPSAFEKKPQVRTLKPIGGKLFRKKLVSVMKFPVEDQELISMIIDQFIRKYDALDSVENVKRMVSSKKAKINS